MRLSIVLSGVLLLLASVAGLAAEPTSANDRQSLTFYLENDLFANTDRYYTNGIRISWLSPDLEALRLPEQVQRVSESVPLLHQPGFTNNLGLALGQNMYTPEDTQVRSLIEADRPYAGWLYGAMSLHHKNDRELHVLELTLGVVGPRSLAENAQKEVHRGRRLPQPQGWNNQLHNEPGAILTYEQKRRFARDFAGGPFGCDLIPDTSASVGNVLTQATAGATFRLGYNVPHDFHGNRIRVSGYTQPLGREQASTGWAKQLSVYVFASAEGKAVGRDIFLDGNTFAESHRVDKNSFVGEVELGFGVRYRDYRLTYAQVMRTREFKTQTSDQQFGAVNLSVSF